VTHFERDYGVVRYDEAAGVVVCRLTDYVEGEQFREYMNAILEVVEETGCQQLLSDNTGMRPLDQTDQAWSVTDWAPRAEEAGLEDVAFVLPESQLAQLSFDSVMEMTEDTMNRGYFEDPDEARAWLRERTRTDDTDEPTVTGLGD